MHIFHSRENIKKTCIFTAVKKTIFDFFHGRETEKIESTFSFFLNMV